MILRKWRTRYCFSPTSSFVNEADLEKDFDGFARKMRFKRYFKNEIFFSILLGQLKKFDLNREEYLTMRSLQNDKSIITNPAD